MILHYFLKPVNTLQDWEVGWEVALNLCRAANWPALMPLKAILSAENNRRSFLLAN